MITMTCSTRAAIGSIRIITATIIHGTAIRGIGATIRTTITTGIILPFMAIGIMTGATTVIIIIITTILTAMAIA
jgi:hypothetical protein